jgi:hypothetical protein
MKEREDPSHESAGETDDSAMRRRLMMQLGITDERELDAIMGKAPKAAPKPRSPDRDIEHARSHAERTRLMKERLARQLGSDDLSKYEEFVHADVDTEMARKDAERVEMAREAAQAARDLVNEMEADAAKRAAELSRRTPWPWVLGSVAVVVLVVLVLFMPLLFVDLPDAAKLAPPCARVAEQVLPLYDSPTTPLQIVSSNAVLLSHTGATRASYDAVVTLQLKESLYAPASSIGAQSYLQLQQSLSEARFNILQHRLHLEVPALRELVELPLLLESAHRRGEKLVVKLTLEARRSVVGWRFQAAPLVQRRASRELGGKPLNAWAGTEVLLFGVKGDSAEIRRRMNVARKFIVEVQKELARRGLAARR